MNGRYPANCGHSQRTALGMVIWQYEVWLRVQDSEFNMLECLSLVVVRMKLDEPSQLPDRLPREGYIDHFLAGLI